MAINKQENNHQQDGVLPVLQSKQEIKAFYNKISSVYDYLAEKSEEPVRKTGLEYLDAKEGETVLEIGCGTGHSLAQLARAVGDSGKAYGIDISDKMLEKTRELLEEEGLLGRTELVCDDAASMPFDSSTFDALFTSFTLELFDIPEIDTVISECKRVLKPNGRIVVVSLTKLEKDGAVMKMFEWTHKHFPNLLNCRPIYVQRALESAGFHIQNSTIEHIWVPVEIVLGIKKE